MTIEALSRMSGRLSRSPECERRYAERKQFVLARYASYDDYVRIKHLAFRKRRRADGRIEAVAHPGARALYFGRNEFPYYGLGPGVSHWVLFSLVPLSKRQVDALLSVYLPEGAPRAHFVNPPSSRSVPGVWHAQVFFSEQMI